MSIDPTKYMNSLDEYFVPSIVSIRTHKNQTDPYKDECTRNKICVGSRPRTNETPPVSLLVSSHLPKQCLSPSPEIALTI